MECQGPSQDGKMKEIKDFKSGLKQTSVDRNQNLHPLTEIKAKPASQGKVQKQWKNGSKTVLPIKVLATVNKACLRQQLPIQQSQVRWLYLYWTFINRRVKVINMTRNSGQLQKARIPPSLGLSALPSTRELVPLSSWKCLLLQIQKETLTQRFTIGSRTLPRRWHSELPNPT